MTVVISLPDALQEFIEEQVAHGGYSTASEYVQALICEDQKRKAEEKLEALLLEGLEGEGIPVTKEWWEQFHVRLLERHRKASGP